MLTAAMIGFREGLEAALIVGIVVGYLVKTGQGARVRVAWAGVAAAVAASTLLAFGLNLVGARLEGPAEQLFEGATMLLAVLVLTGMIFWMRTQSRFLKASLEHELKAAVTSGAALTLFGVAFMAVFREGVETALLLAAAAFANDGLGTLIGAVLGLGAAVVTGWLLYRATLRLNLRVFFSVTSLLLLFFAAGLFAHAIHEFQEAGLLPIIIEHVWNLNPLLNEGSALGQILTALFGYNGDPSLLEVSGYAGYWVAVLLGGRWWVNRRAAQRPPVPTQPAPANVP
jgi:high-affinity iron transporter